MNRRDFIKYLSIATMGSVIPFNVKSDIDNKTTNQLSELKEIYSIIFNLYKENYIPTDNIKYNKLLSHNIIRKYCDYMINNLKPKYKNETTNLIYHITYSYDTSVLLINNPKITKYLKCDWPESWDENNYKNISNKSLKFNGIIVKFNHFNHTLKTYRIELNDIPDLMNDWSDECYEPKYNNFSKNLNSQYYFNYHYNYKTVV